MKTKTIENFLIIFLGIIILLILIPLIGIGVIWSLNVLFNLGIVYEVETVCASVFLFWFFGAGRLISGGKK